MLKALFRSWWNRPGDLAVGLPVPAGAPPPEVSEAMQARVARWFADEPPEIVALALDSVSALAAAGPRFPDGAVANETSLAWLAVALDGLEAMPEPLPVPRQAPALPWRYLILTRGLCDALETAYGETWRRGAATRCPLTRTPDPCPAPRALRPPRPRVPVSSAGLGALLAGSCLPAAGQRRLFEAQALGVNWVDSAAFWRALAAGAPGRSEQAAARNAETASASTEKAHPGYPAKTTGTAAARNPAETARAAPPASGPDPANAGADPWCAIARTALAALVAAPRFNRQSGEGWFADGAFYVAAKPFAEQLQAHPWVAARAELRNRKALYRQLAARGLILPHGPQKVWALFVSEPGPADARYVSALKLSPSLYDGLETCPAFQGTLRPARARERMA